MNVGIFLGHPAHFHLLKNVADRLMSDGHNVRIVAKRKDILEDLIKGAGYEYTLIRQDRGNSKIELIKSVLHMEYGMCQFIRNYKIDILIGSTLTFAARIIKHIPVIEVGEDDASVVPRMAFVAYPYASSILSPVSCNNGKWESKSIHYASYHELAYLHPNHFVADKAVVEKYGINTDKPYFIIRFAQLTAHHDNGIKGINTEIAQRLIDILQPHGRILITSERELEPQFEPYRMAINPLDIHHVMAFASLYIGDSQTMAAEAGVLGVPFVRFNGFVGRIGYLDELERVYGLGFGVRPEKKPVEGLTFPVEHYGEQAMYDIVENLLAQPDLKALWQEKRRKLLSDKIDYAQFLTWFIEHYPDSAKQMRENPSMQYSIAGQQIQQ